MQFHKIFGQGDTLREIGQKLNNNNIHDYILKCGGS